MDHRARAALAILIEQALLVENANAQSIAEDPATCPNCGVFVVSKTSPYCSDCCRERAAFIRQLRGRLANHTISDEQGQTAKGEQMWRLLGGGLPRRLSLVPEKAKERVIKKAQGKCEICGAPATHVDNTGSG